MFQGEKLCLLLTGKIQSRTGWQIIWLCCIRGSVCALLEKEKMSSLWPWTHLSECGYVYGSEQKAGILLCASASNHQRSPWSWKHIIEIQYRLILYCRWWCYWVQSSLVVAYRGSNVSVHFTFWWSFIFWTFKYLFLERGIHFLYNWFLCICFHQEGLANFLFCRELPKSCAERKTVHRYGWTAVTAWCKLLFGSEEKASTKYLSNKRSCATAKNPFEMQCFQSSCKFLFYLFMIQINS